MKAIAYKRSILNRYANNIRLDENMLERRHELNHECYCEAKASKSYDEEFCADAIYHSSSLLKEILK